MVTIPCTSVSAGSWGYSAVSNYLDDAYDANGLTFGKGSNLSEFDQWGGLSLSNKGRAKSQTSNGYADAVIIIWRNHLRSCQGGDGVWPRNIDTLGPFSGSDVGSAFGSCGSGEAAFRLVLGEYFHVMYGGNEWHTGSGAAAWTFLTGLGSYSITAQSRSASNAICGWDRFHLGWYHPDNTLDTIAALNQSSDPIVSDLTIGNNPDSSIFILRDHYATGDAVRIKLPHINWQQSGDVKNQYLWLENRQLLSDFDVNKGCDKWADGLYSYIQIGKDVKHSSSGSGVLFPCDNTGCGSDRNGQGNFLFPLTAEGNWDFKYVREDTVQCNSWDNCCWGNKTLPIDRSSVDTKPSGARL